MNNEPTRDYVKYFKRCWNKLYGHITNILKEIQFWKHATQYFQTLYSSDCHILNILWCLKKCSKHFWVNPCLYGKAPSLKLIYGLGLVVDIIVFYWFGHHRYRWLLQNWTIKSKYLVLVSLVNITPYYPTVVKLKIPTGPCIWC